MEQLKKHDFCPKCSFYRTEGEKHPWCDAHVSESHDNQKVDYWTWHFRGAIHPFSCHHAKTKTETFLCPFCGGKHDFSFPPQKLSGNREYRCNHCEMLFSGTITWLRKATDEEKITEYREKYCWG